MFKNSKLAPPPIVRKFQLRACLIYIEDIHFAHSFGAKYQALFLDKITPSQKNENFIYKLTYSKKLSAFSVKLLALKNFPLVTPGPYQTPEPKFWLRPQCRNYSLRGIR